MVRDVPMGSEESVVASSISRIVGLVFEDAPKDRVSVCALRVSVLYCVIKKKDDYVTNSNSRATTNPTNASVIH